LSAIFSVICEEEEREREREKEEKEDVGLSCFRRRGDGSSRLRLPKKKAKRGLRMYKYEERAVNIHSTIQLEQKRKPSTTQLEKQQTKSSLRIRI